MKAIAPSEALLLLETSLRKQGYSRNTIRAYSSDIKTYFEHERIEVLDPREFARTAQDFVTSQIASQPPATAKRRLSALRSFAAAVGYDVPMPGFRMPTVGVPPAHPLPGGMDDAKLMLKSATTPEHAALIALTSFAGLRISEARSIRPSSIKRDRMQMRVVGKGSRERWLPVTPELLAILDACKPADQPDDDPYISLSDRGARKAFTTLGAKCGIKRPVASHDGRMTFGSAVYNNTLDLRVTQDLLGHADPKTTVRYTLVDDRAKTDAVKGIW